ncbi:DUF2975 domain-containing protein [Secundilactobacillus kimchicus]|uniref:DUF2975 domain-containing protein n=1 Tax=Secundilactobacillus kimchicus TaxID=528209 RepID=UPI001C02889C|nr:DUF2975 domain-containing protein [Secundilactobacillus kimchicus]MBT9671527.1 DUF2975 domain-containing protein [Secundilactobacillus kimchicus]
MSKKLKIGLQIVSFFLYFGLIGAALQCLTPLGSLLQLFSGSAANDILHDSDYLVIGNHAHLSATTISHFPEVPYGICTTIGSALLGIGSLYVTWALLQIIANMNRGKYFTVENQHCIKNILISLGFFCGATTFLAAANQMTESYLFRTNVGYQAATWSDIGSYLFLIIVVGLIYTVFNQALSMKKEQDLTV